MQQWASRARGMIVTAAAAAVVVAASLTFSAVADSIWIKGLERPQAKVIEVKDGRLTYESAGQTRIVDLADVTRLRIDGETNLNAAEDAFAARDYDRATTSYEKVLGSSAKPWVKEWATLKLLRSANESKRFDAAVKAFIALAEQSPESARGVTLELPEKGSRYLEDASRLLERAVSSARNDATRAVLADLAARVAERRGDQKAIDAALRAAAEAAIAANPNSPEAQRKRVQLALHGLKQSLAAKEYDKVIAEVERQAPTILAPADQADALLLVAQAREGKASASTKAEDWKEVAIAYLRAAANAGGNDEVAATALLRVAAIHETRLNEAQTARKLYERVAAEYKDLPAGKQAGKEAERLKAQG